MDSVYLVVLFSVIQVFGFGVLVGRARRKYGLKVPAMAGHPIVERYIRVQQNTFELMIMLFASLFCAVHYWGPNLPAVLGGIYLIGRFVYLRGYVQSPERRHLGFGISVIPIFLLIILGIAGAIQSLLTN